VARSHPSSITIQAFRAAKETKAAAAVFDVHGTTAS
jgi:hypothetical protein